MFNYIRGTVAHAGRDYVVLDNNGIGWLLHVPSTVLSTVRPAAEATLYTYMAVREDDVQLYGFLSADELSLFKMLISVSGVGPKAALGVLSTLSAAEFHLAVMHENVKALTRVPGVGPKSAKRLIVELKEKVASLGTAVPAFSGLSPGPAEPFADALEALLALGYNGTEAQAALLTVESRETMDTTELLRKALAALGSK
jgi:holliday junction DNA helicase RuvA